MKAVFISLYPFHFVLRLIAQVIREWLWGFHETQIQTFNLSTPSRIPKHFVPVPSGTDGLMIREVVRESESNLLGKQHSETYIVAKFFPSNRFGSNLFHYISWEKVSAFSPTIIAPYVSYRLKLEVIAGYGGEGLSGVAHKFVELVGEFQPGRRVVFSVFTE